MAANEDYAPTKDMVNAVVQSAEKLEGEAHLDARRQGRHRADHARRARSGALHRGDLRRRPRRCLERGLKTRASPSRTGPYKTRRFLNLQSWSQNRGSSSMPHRYEAPIRTVHRHHMSRMAERVVPLQLLRRSARIASRATGPRLRWRSPPPLPTAHHRRHIRQQLSHVP